MAKIYLSPSKVADFENCRWQFMLKHVWNWKEKTPSINLIVGDCLDKAVMAFLAGQFVGQSVDPVALFTTELETQIANGAAFGSKWTPENVQAMGIRLMEQFPEYWERSGLTVLADPAGEPIMQRLLELDLGDDVVFRTKLDLACATRDGDIAIIDVKSAAMEFPEVLAPLSDQITACNIAVLAHAESLGLQSVDKVASLR
ncbi:MAG: PD-(D/E)XK nuclease family protein [Xanthomonadales bacterium]|nr:PD-(D/E)XK nuclease family protein [Xanthomonadales bacterium]